LTVGKIENKRIQKSDCWQDHLKKKKKKEPVWSKIRTSKEGAVAKFFSEELLPF
jgi:hypothetical protein